MNINYENTEAEAEVLLGLLDKFEKEDVKGKEKGYIKRVVSAWRKHIQNGEIKEQAKKNPAKLLEKHEKFCLEHELYDGEKISMYFDINELRYWMKINKIPADNVELLKCIANIHFIRTEDEDLTPSFDKTPIIAVPMYKMGEDKKYSTYEVVDGNKRISAALHLQKNIKVQMVTIPFLPLQCFENKTSWILYNLLEGIYLMAMGDFSEPERYLKELDGFLDFNYQTK